ncbi:MAG: FAD/NAD(P)-binding protein [Acidimicrobiia bacterium]
MTTAILDSGVARAEPMLPRPFRVTSARVETADTTTLLMTAADDGPSIEFRPGQFTMIYVPGVGEVPISISGDPSHPAELQHTIRRVGAVTNAICDLEIDDRVGIRGPYGKGWPTQNSTGKDVLIIAGGIGIAPLRPAILDVLGHRDRFHSVSVLYGSRTPEDLLFEDDLHAWRARFDIEAEVTVDRGERDWHGDVGVVTTLLPRVSFSPTNTVAMVCGPEIMMKIVARELVDLGLAADSVYVSIERNMKCGIGFCGHCQFGSSFACRDGPVMTYESVSGRFGVSEI